MHKIRKRVIWILIIILIVTDLLWYTNRVLLIKRTDGITTMQDFYAQDKGTVDVLFIGSSHSGMNLDMAYLWSEYGISGYSLWGSVQPFWNSYYFLKEAFKYQNPKVVVLDMYAATLDFEFSDDARQVTNIEGMKLGLNKLNAIQVSCKKDRWFNMISGFPIYHSRYAELTKDDFLHFPWTDERKFHKGNGCRYGTGNVKLTDVSGITEKKKVLEKEEKYLSQIIELCKEKNVPLVFVTTPTAHREDEQPYYNTVSDIAIENGIDYYNFNLLDEETGFNADDYWTDNAHVNTEGARKITRYLAWNLKEEYDLKDHRNDKLYESWDKNQINIINEYISSITDMDAWFEELKSSDRDVFLIKNSSWEDSEEWSVLLDRLCEIGCDRDVLQKSGGDWLIQDTASKKSFKNQYFGDMYSEFEFDGKIFSADFKDGNGIQVDGKELYSLKGPGIIMVVYDSNTHQVIDTVECLKSEKFSFDRINTENR